MHSKFSEHVNQFLCQTMHKENKEIKQNHTEKLTSLGKRAKRHTERKMK
jgi:hypothetical protein